MTTTESSTTPASESTQPAEKRSSWQHGPLPEIIGYVGAALVASAGLNLVGQSWDSWPIPVRFGLSVAGVLALYAAAVTLTVTIGGRGPLVAHVARRRMVGVLASLAAPLIAVAIALAFDWAGIAYDTANSRLPLIFVGAAVLATVVAAWWAPGVVPTLAVAGASLIWLETFTGIVIAPLEQPLVIAATGAVAAVTWLAVAPRLLPPRVLTEALGIAAFIVLQLPEAFRALDMPPLLDDVAEQRLTWAMWFARIALLAFAAAALILFARGASWPWAVGGVIAAGAGALSIAGQTLGLIAGLFVAGIILLAVSGVILVARSRDRQGSATSDRAP
jgi:hypothetical protein